mmetsp:Transcript_46806/g.100246  ORF Transcript_46806/g.100246 Transcript_46806/m.100246 type:complete len:256 (-) Transcript_46806:193-960(-)
MAPVVTLHDELVCSCDEAQAVALVELLGDVRAEGVARPSGTDAPATLVFGVAPEKVAHGPLVRDLLDSVDLPNVIQGLDVGRESSVLAEDLVVHQGRERQVVEEVGEALPCARAAILAHTLVVEAIDLGDLSAFVVPPEHCDSFPEPHLEAEEQRDALHREVPSVYIVAQEEIVGVWRKASNAEELHEVMELSVHIPAYRDWTPHGLHIALARQNLLGQFAYLSHLRLQQRFAVGQLLNTPLHIQGWAGTGHADG